MNDVPPHLPLWLLWIATALTFVITELLTGRRYPLFVGAAAALAGWAGAVKAPAEWQWGVFLAVLVLGLVFVRATTPGPKAR
ncbi:MAG: hypothetical protein KC466_21245 [Myxococcales bacterium]|nr:hypothetical protein [Myxococcales bacterium]